MALTYLTKSAAYQHQLVTGLVRGIRKSAAMGESVHPTAKLPGPTSAENTWVLNEMVQQRPLPLLPRL